MKNDRKFDIVPILLGLSAIVTIALLVLSYFSKEGNSEHYDNSNIYKHQQVKHGEVKEY